MAEKLGFRAGPIEGPIHFSQLVPLLAHVFGQAFFERGCLGHMWFGPDRIQQVCTLATPHITMRFH